MTRHLDRTWLQIVVRQHQLSVCQSILIFNLQFLRKASNLAVADFLHPGEEVGVFWSMPT